MVPRRPCGHRDATGISRQGRALTILGRSIEHYRINAFSGVPTVYATLLQTPLGSHDVSSVEFGYCGAAPMPTELFRSFEAKSGIRILEAYGLTEGGCVSSVNPPDAEPRIGSVGLRLPYQDMAVMILDEAGVFLRLAEVDEPGVLAIKGPNVFRVTSTRSTTPGSGSTAGASAGSTPATSPARTQTAISG